MERSSNPATGGVTCTSGDGEGPWFLSTLMTVKATTEDTGAFTFLESLCPPGFGPPPHIRHRELETFYLLDGEVEVICGEQHWDARRHLSAPAARDPAPVQGLRRRSGTAVAADHARPVRAFRPRGRRGVAEDL
jgi:hypothetical protein